MDGLRGVPITLGCKGCELLHLCVGIPCFLRRSSSYFKQYQNKRNGIWGWTGRSVVIEPEDLSTREYFGPTMEMLPMET